MNKLNRRLSAACHLPKPWKEASRANLAICVSFPVLPTPLPWAHQYPCCSNMHITSEAMQCFDCTWCTCTQAEVFSVALKMWVWGYAVQ